MKIYSPSQTKAFLECPMLWSLGRKGWTPRTYNKGNLYAIRGSAVSDGLDAYNRGKSAQDITTAVEESVARLWVQAKIDHREWVEFKSAPLSLDEVTTQALELVGAYSVGPPTAYTVQHAEYVFANHGNARADVLGLNPQGRLIPVDYKCKDIPAVEYYRHLAKQAYRYDWQLMHYCWAVSEEFQTACFEFGIVILWYGKNPQIEYLVYSVSPTRLKLWYESATAVWERMERCELGLEPITEVAEHSNRFGLCVYHKACLEYHRDEDLMIQDYFLNPRG